MTIVQAVGAYPPNHNGRFIIYIKAGLYEEQVTVPQSCPNLFIYGDGIGQTIVTGDKFGSNPTITTTFANEARGFIARGITFRNTAGPNGHPAPAFRSQGDETALFECSFESCQDTLQYQQFKQYYGNCLIYGTIDFIFGKGEAVIQNSAIIVRKPGNTQISVITADGREVSNGSGGLVIQNCNISRDESLIEPNVKTYLGRPWKTFARTVVMESYLDEFIAPEGWMVWNNESYHETCQVFEYSNRGPGANTERRSKLFLNFKVLKTTEAANFTTNSFIAGESWLPETCIPYSPGL
ncbi:pectinesterase 4 [Phtheirospermum japonicum]|uniref:Pectinesterase n=1 Tax=Phtheirospermum japonicum TaxID=374723 RepID=A0A830CRW9_9LAMI|nr:pectinesterase 4 [Phtheirospermum japonicum]